MYSSFDLVRHRRLARDQMHQVLAAEKTELYKRRKVAQPLRQSFHSIKYEPTPTDGLSLVIRSSQNGLWPDDDIITLPPEHII